MRNDPCPRASLTASAALRAAGAEYFSRRQQQLQTVNVVTMLLLQSDLGAPAPVVDLGIILR